MYSSYAVAYIKKEDVEMYVRNFEKNNRKVYIILGIIFCFFSVILAISFSNLEIYRSDFSLELKSALSSVPYFTVAFYLLLTFFSLRLTKKSLDQKTIDEAIKPYKEGEMIHVNRLLPLFKPSNNWQNLTILILMMLTPLVILVSGLALMDDSFRESISKIFPTTNCSQFTSATACGEKPDSYCAWYECAHSNLGACFKRGTTNAAAGCLKASVTPIQQNITYSNDFEDILLTFYPTPGLEIKSLGNQSYQLNETPGGKDIVTYYPTEALFNQSKPNVRHDATTAVDAGTGEILSADTETINFNIYQKRYHYYNTVGTTKSGKYLGEKSTIYLTSCVMKLSTLGGHGVLLFEPSPGTDGANTCEFIDKATLQISITKK